MSCLVSIFNISFYIGLAILGLLKAGESPEDAHEIVQKLKQAPFDNLKPWIEKPEVALSKQARE